MIIIVQYCLCDAVLPSFPFPSITVPTQKKYMDPLVFVKYNPVIL